MLQSTGGVKKLTKLENGASAASRYSTATVHEVKVGEAAPNEAGQKVICAARIVQIELRQLCSLFSFYLALIGT